MWKYKTVDTTNGVLFRHRSQASDALKSFNKNAQTNKNNVDKQTVGINSDQTAVTVERALEK